MRTIFIDAQRYYVPDDTFPLTGLCDTWQISRSEYEVRCLTSYGVKPCRLVKIHKRFDRTYYLLYPASNRNIRQVPPDYSTQHPVAIFLRIIMNMTHEVGGWVGGGENCSHVYLFIYLFTATGLLTGGSGYFTWKQNMKLVTTRFKSGGLHEKHVVATWNLGNHLSICL